MLPDSRQVDDRCLPFPAKKRQKAFNLLSLWWVFFNGYAVASPSGAEERGILSAYAAAAEFSGQITFSL